MRTRAEHVLESGPGRAPEAPTLAFAPVPPTVA